MKTRIPTVCKGVTLQDRYLDITHAHMHVHTHIHTCANMRWGEEVMVHRGLGCALSSVLGDSQQRPCLQSNCWCH